MAALVRSDVAVAYCQRCDSVIFGYGDAFSVAKDHERDEHANVAPGQIIYERLS